MSQFKHFIDGYITLKGESAMWTLENNIRCLITEFVKDNKDVSIVELRLLSDWLTGLFAAPFCFEIMKRGVAMRKQKLAQESIMEQGKECMK